MIERIVTPRLADIIEAIERIRRVLDGVTLEAFEQSWEKRWLVERGIEVISEASRHLTDDIKERRTEVPWSKVAGIGNVLRHAYDHVAPDVCFGSLRKTIWQQSKKFAGRNWSWLRSRSGTKISISNFADNPFARRTAID
jgi:uncharacterized protein with HEPN domain